MWPQLHQHISIGPLPYLCTKKNEIMDTLLVCEVYYIGTEVGYRCFNYNIVYSTLAMLLQQFQCKRLIFKHFLFYSYNEHDGALTVKF